MISLHEIDFSNRDLGVGFMATSFSTALEKETAISLTDLIEDNEMTVVNW